MKKEKRMQSGQGKFLPSSRAHIYDKYKRNKWNYMMEEDSSFGKLMSLYDKEKTKYVIHKTTNNNA
ncbi:hypothetical protein C922_05437 [Plasmodium inui San Antonio 1]|uniref:Uncharacterized protein n=1 Tax=Plasmodium inui San Antonio 1 TaxID=1237626 RepID=W7A503_9APIC|nr:hypothetical protein C922_05437 [Plasmodium inui San Antonio 1]EUD64184.1 hypothetical protein C922_05437 [Plasmodium inui San Antonio 1]